MKLLKIVKSQTAGKKWDAHFQLDSGKEHVTHFGALGYTDYTIGASDERRKAYLTRHNKDLHTHDPSSAGYLSYYILWGSSRSMRENTDEFKRKFRL
jgi:hypothetical protein